MPILKCEVCGNEKEVPVCCDQSMIAKDSYMLCCCKSDNCGYQKIPECCNQPMHYIEH